MKHLFFVTVTVLVFLASCTTNDYISHDVTAQEDDGVSICFGFDLQPTTRADIVGASAANLLGGNFYVTGTKGTEGTSSPSPTLVFDNYLVHYIANTAGTTTTNSANWEYVGVIPGTAPTANHIKLSSLNTQTIKFWDYSADQYDFLAFSTGTFKPVAGSSGADDEIGVTAMKYGNRSCQLCYSLYFRHPIGGCHQEHLYHRYHKGHKGKLWPGGHPAIQEPWL